MTKALRKPTMSEEIKEATTKINERPAKTNLLDDNESREVKKLKKAKRQIEKDCLPRKEK